MTEQPTTGEVVLVVASMRAKADRIERAAVNLSRTRGPEKQMVQQLRVEATALRRVAAWMEKQETIS